ncbi:hypothetical protein GCM10007301_15670 [Azorhizobium oxalatiphilum]|uniref:Holin of 3TMs, for gene-transfer release n=1 Tax=Azorhizobium oxalatiphilum TaxID=980631 RepID=A0A917BU30_9HYPH|nr:hypothetical protein [Azorhizobium oxalatiphilum]GGF56838.1 hypothetical protein GCM10007301_15670 [Azorhizobium oxalatiphilum]
MIGLLTTILSWLSGGLVDRVLDTLNKRVDAQTEQEKLRTQITVEAIKAEVASRQSDRDVLVAEQGRWYTAMVRPLLAAPVIIFLWKVIVWDKVLGLGTTDALNGTVADWAGAIVTTYVGGRSVEKVAALLTRKSR